jgi:hypothetical protein|tara:strand:+ start:688 stop:1023 length:336 start_codon:yes stop_codon:yes gene_type:complete
MSSLISASIKASELKKIDPNKVIKGKQDNYIPILISINDDSKYGKNVSISVQQEKEERDNKTPKHFLGNGSVIWTDGTVKKGVKEDEDNNSGSFDTTSPAKSGALDNDLPF